MTCPSGESWIGKGRKSAPSCEGSLAVGGRLSRPCAPVDSTAMGRSAAKVGDIEKALEKLSVFEGQIFSVFKQSLADNSGVCSFRRPVSKMAPGLQRSSPGLVCGTLPGEELQVARPIEASRIDFRGEPLFDPTPFLDERGEKIFNRPI